jgi:uncharacterized membrane protein
MPVNAEEVFEVLSDRFYIVSLIVLLSGLVIGVIFGVLNHADPLNMLLGCTINILVTISVWVEWRRVKKQRENGLL